VIALEALQFAFFQKALLAALIVSVACGIIGTFVVVKEVSSVSGGLAHAAFGGVGLGYLLGFSPMLGAAAFSVALGVVIGGIYLRYRDSLETLVALIWSLGMALGVLFLALTPGYAADLTSYLFGNILLVSTEFLWWGVVLDLIVVGAVALLYKEFQAVSFDEEHSRVLGVPVAPVFLLMMVLIALVVVVLIRIVGMILTIALLTVPAMIAHHWMRSLRSMMVMSSVFSGVSCVVGLLLSYEVGERWDTTVPPGPLVILVVIASYILSLTLRGLKSRA
jgi:zinc transport system permease protein